MSVQPAYPPRPPDESPAAERRRLIRERDSLRIERDQLQAAHDAVAARNAELAEQLAATQAIARMLQALAIEILGLFQPPQITAGDLIPHHAAFARSDDIARWRKTAGLEPQS